MPKLEISRRAFLGIDPGATGAAVLLFDDDSVDVLRLSKVTDAEAWKWFAGTAQAVDAFACIEKVGGYVGVGQPGSAMFQFGRSTGKLLGFLVAAGIPFEEVSPQAWQKALGIAPRRKKSKKGGPGESGTEWKRRLRQKAEELFPDVEMTNDLADALLIAEHCRRVREPRTRP